MWFIDICLNNPHIFQPTIFYTWLELKNKMIILLMIIKKKIITRAKLVAKQRKGFPFMSGVKLEVSVRSSVPMTWKTKSKR